MVVAQHAGASNIVIVITLHCTVVKLLGLAVWGIVSGSSRFCVYRCKASVRQKVTQPYKWLRSSYDTWVVWSAARGGS